VLLGTALLIGCRPTEREETQTIQCLNGLRLAYLSALMKLDEATNSVGSNTLNIVKRTTNANCPLWGLRYAANPDPNKWVHPESFPAEIALFCPHHHFKTLLGAPVFTAVMFDGSLGRIEQVPVWFSTNNAAEAAPGVGTNSK